MVKKTLQVYGFLGLVPAETVKKLLERWSGEGTVYAIKVRDGNKGRSFAIVQFTTIQAAEVIFSLATARHLYHGSSYLTARRADHDIVRKPRVSLHRIDDTRLMFGCQISKQKFSILWKEDNVSVDFGIQNRSFSFQLPPSNGTQQYKLDLSYENIWHISLHRPRGCHVEYLLIQLLGAPRIYIYDGKPIGSELSSSFLYNFCKDGSDEQWSRTTDFTRNSCIGQSSALCLVLSHGCALPDFQDNFPNYTESEEPFTLENGKSFSCNLDLVPIVRPAEEISLPYNILFKINMLLQNGCLSGPSLDSSFYRMVDPRRMDVEIIASALERMYHLKECCYEPVTWLNDQYVKTLRDWKRAPRGSSDSNSKSLGEGLVYVHRVQITPCKVYFFGPEINISNHVLRTYSEYIDNFLRVSFLDETLDNLYSMDLASRSSSGAGGRKTEVYRRILSTLNNGIAIGDKNFQFLAFSSSQLRDNSAWMFAPTAGLTAKVIREKMGDFHEIKNVAKYAARLGQSFSSSTQTLTVHRSEMERIDDIIRNGYTFSDGIGKMSLALARKVASKCGLNGYVPSAFQIRYGGFKGVVAVDPTSSVKLSLRKSMSKYESEENKLNVITWSKYQPCFLNRQLVTLLSTLGVGDHVFERMQKEAVDQLDAILTDSLKAQEALDLMAPGENTQILKEMLACGYKPDKEPFLVMMLRTFRASKLFELRTKTRIFHPNGRAMMGCLDETGTLQYGQVFVQYSGRNLTQFGDASSSTHIGSASGRHFLVQGRVVVAKNPCLHPGDVRVLTAINAPALHHMVDCVVFPQKGMRPHPNECSGSDLDGDIYFVSWDSSLLPPCQDPPMDYTPAPTVELDHAVTIEEVEEYFVDYILNESLGKIANAHTVFADTTPQKARSKECIQLAKLFSIAVDFPKTGVPAEIPHGLYAKEYPDFMEKLDKPTYESKNVIGKLFRKVKDIAPEPSQLKTFTKEMAEQSFDSDMLVNGYDDFIEDAFYYKDKYDTKLGDLMDYYGIRTEAEILSGCIMKMSKSFTKRRDADAITMAVKSLRKEARTWFNAEDTEDTYAKASAWYYVTYHPSYWGRYNEGFRRDHYLSFAWCIYDKLVHIKHLNNRRGRNHTSSSYLEERVRGLHLN